MSKNKLNKKPPVKNLKLAQLKRELNYCKNTIRKREKEWKQTCSEISRREISDQMMNSWHHFEKAADAKDFEISLYMDELRQQEEYQSAKIRIHQECIEKLMYHYSDMLRKIHQENNSILINMIQNSLDDWRIQMRHDDVFENYFKVMMFGLGILRKRWVKMTKTENFTKVNEENTKYSTEVQSSSSFLELKLEDMWSKFLVVEEDYWKRANENKKHHDLLKEVDDITTKNIQKELEKLMKLQVTAKRLTFKSKELVGTLGKKIECLNSERDSLHEVQLALRSKTHQGRDEDDWKCTLMSVEFLKAFDALNVTLKKGENMIKIVKSIHRYETLQEKISPYPVRSHNEFKSSPPELMLFWQRKANAEALRYTLNEERIFLKKQNAKLLKKIHSFCACLQCPSLPEVPLRAGKIPYTEGREMVQKQKIQIGKKKKSEDENSYV